jgi:PAS domain S-box-containing protein
MAQLQRGAAVNDTLEKRRLARLHRLKVLDTESEGVFDALVRTASLISGQPIALISLIDGERQWFKANHGLAGVSETPRSVAFCDHAIRTADVLEVPDAQRDARFVANPLVTGDPGIRFYAGAPITMPEGERIGTVCVIGREPGELTPQQVQGLKDLAEIAKTALLQRQRLHDLTALGGEGWFEAIDSASPMGMLQADRSGEVFQTNTRLEALFGLDGHSLLGQGWMSVVHAEDRDEVAARWNASVQASRPFDTEFRIERADAAVVDLRLQAKPGEWGEPAQRGWVGMAEDVTHRRQAERELLRTARFLERAELLGGVGGWEADLVGRQVRWTEHTARIYGLPPGHQPAFEEHRQYFDAAALATMDAAARRAVLEQQPWDVELPMTTATGRAIWVRSVGEAEFEDGRAVRLVGALQDVTSERTQREALQSANALLTSILEHLPCGLSVFDADLDLVAHNRQFQSLLEFPQRLFESPKPNFETFIRFNAERGEYGDGPADDAVRRIVDRARAPTAHHLQRERSGGAALDIRGAPLPGGGFVTTYVDVSASRAAELALRESEERQKRALDASGLALWDLDLVSQKLYLSEQWSQMRGGPARPTETSLHQLLDLVPLSQHRELSTALAAALRGDTDGYVVEHQVYREDGVPFWIQSVGRITRRDEAGQALGLTGTNKDITQRKAAEDQLARGAAMTRATLESTDDGILVMNAQREVMLYNQRFCELWNIGDELTGTGNPALVAHASSQLEDPDLFTGRVAQLYARPLEQGFDVLRFKNGRVLERYGRPMLLDGQPIGRVWSFRDVTDRYRVDAEIKQAREAAEAASRAKSEFLDNVSHEIRTPLNGVMGMLRLLQGSPLDARQREYVGIAQGSATGLLGLINDLLDISKIEAGRLELEYLPFDLFALVIELQNEYELRARDKQLRLDVQVDASVPRRVVGDALRLRQVLNNLLSNALKFTHEGEVGLVVTAGRDATINLTVHDTGIGIAPEVQQRLFTRFTQADSSTTRQYGGTGLGLAIVQQLCEVMGGQVVLHSTPGQGSSFRCELPLRAALDQEAEAVEPTPDLLSLRPGLRLMVVEDNPTNRVVLLGLLAQASPVEVVVACNGQEAVALADASIAAILMDCRMPVMDGFEATRQLRAAGFTRPIIALTASASPAERQRCLDAGMDDFLSKPIDPALLIETLTRWTSSGSEAAPRAFDRARSLAQLGGNEQLLKGALAAFAQFTPALMEKLRTALRAGDGETVYLQLHSLKGSSGMVAAKEVNALAAQLETAAENKDWAQVSDTLGELERRVTQFLQESANA